MKDYSFGYVRAYHPQIVERQIRLGKAVFRDFIHTPSVSPQTQIPWAPLSFKKGPLHTACRSGQATANGFIQPATPADAQPNGSPFQTCV